MSSTKFYGIWKAINTRTTNPNTKDFKNYASRGIKVLWKNFEEFYLDMHDEYVKHIEKHGTDTSIERVDNDGPYSRKNCKWATRQEQNLNRRSVIYFTYKGKTKCLKEWAKTLSIPYPTAKGRINRGKWTIKEALGITPRHQNHKSESR